MLKITQTYLLTVIMCKTHCYYIYLLKTYLDELNKFLQK